jgi:hypothetical protein
MAADDRQRAELAQLLLPRIGEKAVMALIDTLPPTGEPLATAAQVAALEQRMDDRFDALRAELLAAFRGELVAAASGQARLVIFGILGAVASIAGLSLAFAQLI